jgi:DNA-binding MarR family transcriptional regulator
MATASKKGKAPAAEVADHLHSSAIGLLRALRKQDDKWGLSAPRLSALSVVVFAGPIKLGDLARAEQVRPPTMTKLVRALEAAKLVTRKADRDDGRISWITATERGRSLLMKGRAARVGALTKKIEELTDREVELLERAATLIRDLAKRL